MTTNRNNRILAIEARTRQLESALHDWTFVQRAVKASEHDLRRFVIARDLEQNPGIDRYLLSKAHEITANGAYRYHLPESYPDTSDPDENEPFDSKLWAWDSAGTYSYFDDLLTESNDAAWCKLFQDWLKADTTDSIRHYPYTGYAIRIWTSAGKLTDIGRQYCETLCYLESAYPVLDEDDYIAREYAAESEYLEDLARQLENDTDPFYGDNYHAIPAAYTSDMLRENIRNYDLPFGFSYYGETYMSDTDLERLAVLVSLDSHRDQPCSD